MVEKLNEEPQIDYFITEKGSVYKYLDNGRIQRYKKVENRHYGPQDAIVFIPKYEDLKRLYKDNEQEFNSKLGENESRYNRRIAELVYRDAVAYIVSGDSSKILLTNREINEAKKVFLYFVDRRTQKRILRIPVSKTPQFGYYPYDIRVFHEENGESFMEPHLGHKVIKIEYK